MNSKDLEHEKLILEIRNIKADLRRKGISHWATMITAASTIIGIGFIGFQIYQTLTEVRNNQIKLQSEAEARILDIELRSVALFFESIVPPIMGLKNSKCEYNIDNLKNRVDDDDGIIPCYTGNYVTTEVEVYQPEMQVAAYHAAVKLMDVFPILCSTGLFLLERHVEDEYWHYPKEAKDLLPLWLENSDCYKGSVKEILSAR